MKPQKAIVFDSGTLISFSMNGVTDILERLRQVFNGKFLITQDVRREIIDRPMEIRRFELEALKIKQLLDKGIIEMPSSLGIKDNDISMKAKDVLDTANSLYNGQGKDIHIIDLGEASCLALSKMLTEKGIDNVIAIDERTTRMLGEKPENLGKLLEKRLHVKINSKKGNYDFFKGFRFIRSAELAYVAYKKDVVGLKNGGNEVLNALLYAMKSKGCAISNEEIIEIKKLA